LGTGLSNLLRCFAQSGRAIGQPIGYAPLELPSFSHLVHHHIGQWDSVCIGSVYSEQAGDGSFNAYCSVLINLLLHLQGYAPRQLPRPGHFFQI
jgi:hypothetical protein